MTAWGFTGGSKQPFRHALLGEGRHDEARQWAAQGPDLRPQAAGQSSAALEERPSWRVLELSRDEPDFRRRGEPCVQTLQALDRLVAWIPNMALSEAINMDPRELSPGSDLRNRERELAPRGGDHSRVNVCWIIHCAPRARVSRRDSTGRPESAGLFLVGHHSGRRDLMGSPPSAISTAMAAGPWRPL